jgi:phosphoesterase RecJ-like protein
MFKEILKTIEAYDRILIHGHIRPDGDCYGSQLGLKHFLQENHFRANFTVFAANRCWPSGIK